MGELTLLHICRGVVWAQRRSLLALPPLAIGKSAHRVMSLGELSIHAPHQLQHSGEQTLHLAWTEQQTLEMEAGGTGEPVLEAKAWENWLHHSPG